MAELTPEIRKYFSDLGKKSKGGGRPRIPDSELTPEQRKRRERYDTKLLERIIHKTNGDK